MAEERRRAPAGRDRSRHSLVSRELIKNITFLYDEGLRELAGLPDPTRRPLHFAPCFFTSFRIPWSITV